jgi:hypothetical protein
VVRWGVLAWVPGAILLAVSAVVFVVAPGFTIVNFFISLPLALLSAGLVSLFARLVPGRVPESRLGRTRISVARILVVSWIGAWVLSPLLVILGGPLVLLVLMSLPGVSTSATLAPEFHLYGSLLLSAVPFAAVGLVSAFLLLAVAVKPAPPTSIPAS